MKIELGAGGSKRPGFVKVDCFEAENIDIVHNLETCPLPFDDEVADKVIAQHVLEHITNFNELMNEVWRIMKPGGQFIVAIPQAMDSKGIWHGEAFQDPTHVRFFVPKVWDYFSIDRSLHQNFGAMYGLKGWQVKYEDKGWFANITLTKPVAAQSHDLSPISTD